MIEDEHGLAQPHHDLHVVLDEQDRLARVAKATHGIEELVQQRAVHAGGGLVEQHERRVAHQHTHELDELLLPEGEIAGVFVGERRELDEVEELAGARLRRLARSRRDDEQVLERGHLRKDADHLKRPAHAAPGDLIGLEPVDPRVIEQDASPVTPLDSRDAVEQRCLARAVRADQPIDAPGLERERDAVDRAHAAEALAHVDQREGGARSQIVLGRRYFV